MATSIAKLKDALDAKFIQNQIYGEMYGSPLFGINFGKSVWHWFVTDGENILFLDHSYSMNTGSIKRGISHKISIKRAIEKKVGIKI